MPHDGGGGGGGGVELSAADKKFLTQLRKLSSAHNSQTNSRATTPKDPSSVPFDKARASAADLAAMSRRMARLGPRVQRDQENARRSLHSAPSSDVSAPYLLRPQTSQSQASQSQASHSDTTASSRPSSRHFASHAPAAQRHEAAQQRRGEHGQQRQPSSQQPRRPNAWEEVSQQRRGEHGQQRQPSPQQPRTRGPNAWEEEAQQHHRPVSRGGNADGEQAPQWARTSCFCNMCTCGSHKCPHNKAYIKPAGPPRNLKGSVYQQEFVKFPIQPESEYVPLPAPTGSFTFDHTSSYRGDFQHWDHKHPTLKNVRIPSPPPTPWNQSFTGPTTNQITYTQKTFGVPPRRNPEVALLTLPFQAASTMQTHFTDPKIIYERTNPHPEKCGATGLPFKSKSEYKAAYDASPILKEKPKPPRAKNLAPKDYCPWNYGVTDFGSLYRTDYNTTTSAPPHAACPVAAYPRSAPPPRCTGHSELIL